MKLLLLLFILMQGVTNEEFDCKMFYEKTLVPMSIKGGLIKKEKKSECFIIYK